MIFSLGYISLEFIDPPQVHSLHESMFHLLERTAIERWETQSQLALVALALDLLCGDAFPFCSCLLWSPLLG